MGAGAGALESGAAAGSSEHGGDAPRRGGCESVGGRMGGGCGVVHRMIEHVGIWGFHLVENDFLQI